MEPYNPRYVGTPPPPDTTRPRIRFSGTEVLHLVGAALLLSVAFTVYLIDFGAAIQRRPFRLDDLLPSAGQLVGVLAGLLSGFLLHELAHKVVAQRYGHWAEFRAWVASLLVSIAAAFAGFILAAPGAVMIRGRVTLRENGLISLAGPGTNFVLALAAWPFALVTNPGEFLPTVLRIVAQLNALLCVFNLLPLSFFGNTLDGRKVWWWSKPAYLASMAMAILLGLAILVTTAGA